MAWMLLVRRAESAEEAGRAGAVLTVVIGILVLAGLAPGWFVVASDVGAAAAGAAH